MQDIELLKYPIGKFIPPIAITQAQVLEWISILENFPKLLKNEVSGLTETELQKQYRPNGWTIKQLMHHCGDSHMHSLIRFKLALTEDLPTIKTYHEDLWAKLPDSNTSIETSIQLLEAVHARWVALLKGMNNSDFNKAYYHPEHKKNFTLKHVLGLYAWHCNHHLTHIKIAKSN